MLPSKSGICRFSYGRARARRHIGYAVEFLTVFVPHKFVVRCVKFLRSLNDCGARECIPSLAK